jgi:hypothetical protein
MATNTTTRTRSSAKRATTGRAKAPVRASVQASTSRSTPVEVRTKVGARFDMAASTPKAAAYASLGAGQLAFELGRQALETSRRTVGKGIETSGKVVSVLLRPSEIPSTLAGSYGKAAGTPGKLFQDLSDRGEKLATSIRGSAYTRRAVDQTKVARSRVKAASTSVRKALETATVAGREAVKKVS